VYVYVQKSPLTFHADSLNVKKRSGEKGEANVGFFFPLRKKADARI